MTNVTTRKRVQKIEKAKEIIAELEAQKGMDLSMPRACLYDASKHIGSDRTYFKHMEDAIGRTAGFAIEGGYDDIASDASQLITDIQENVLDDE
ncbi:hypothetical protein [Salinibaculum salinum]|uniref:hypothetical protein n=1 Tax=Salinibaculum salinum TaxID=3131996 RepID=UPI0030EE320E